MRLLLVKVRLLFVQKSLWLLRRKVYSGLRRSIKIRDIDELIKRIGLIKAVREL